MGISTMLRRTATAGAATIGLAAATLLASPAAHAEPSYGGIPSDESAAAYIAGELAAGEDHLSSEFDGESFPDTGLTIDAVLALAAAGNAGDQAEASATWVTENIADYIGFGDDRYASAIGKALYFAVVQGIDPTDVGGVDLVAAIQQTEGTQQPGRYSDISAIQPYTDYSNNIGQSFAILGLERAGVGASDAAVDYLRAAQCSDGGFRLNEDASDPASCESDSETTAFAIQALIAASDVDDPDVQAALDYLASQQQDDGGVIGGQTNPAPNTNSTGLAATAFTAGGRTQEASDAGFYINSVQHSCDGPGELVGVVSMNPAGMAAAETAGAVEEDLRATVQAVYGLSGVDLVTLSADGMEADTPIVDCSASLNAQNADEADDATDADDSNGGLVTLFIVLGILLVAAVIAALVSLRNNPRRADR